jgi:dUTP pyrophosphatase
MRAAKVRVLRLKDVPLPSRQSAGAAGFDIHAAEPASVKPQGFAVVSTGIAIEMPRGLEAQVRPRSGLAARNGIGLLNSPGTIDSDYRGEIKVILFNISGRVFRIRKGDRVAQLVFNRVVDVRLKPAARLSKTTRGDAGFGHTG